MKIKALAVITYRRNGAKRQALPDGSVHDVPDEVAKEAIAEGYAEAAGTQAVQAQQQADDDKARRAALFAEAKALGLNPGPKTGTDRLAELIEKAKAEAEGGE